MGPAIARFLNVVTTLLQIRGASDSAIQILQTASAAVAVHHHRQENLARLTEMVQTMIDEGRDPTRAELAELAEVREALSRRAQAVELPPAASSEPEPDPNAGEPDPNAGPTSESGPSTSSDTVTGGSEPQT